MQEPVPVDVSGRPLRLRDGDLDTLLQPATVAETGASADGAEYCSRGGRLGRCSPGATTAGASLTKPRRP